MTEDKKPFDPSMFKTLDEMRVVFPEEAERFKETEDGKGFVKITAMDCQRAQEEVVKQQERKIIDQLVGDFLLCCKRFLEDPNAPDYNKKRVQGFLCQSGIIEDYESQSRYHDKYVGNTIKNVSNSLVRYKHYMPMPDAQYREICDIPDDERQKIMQRIVDIGAENDLMCHGTYFTKLAHIKSFYGIIAQNPRFKHRWTGTDEYREIINSRSPVNQQQGAQSISCWDPHYEVEALRSIQEERDHTIYAMFIPSWVFNQLPEKPAPYKNTKVESGSALDEAISKFILSTYQCDAAINTVYHTGGNRIVVHGEITFKPEELKKRLLFIRRHRYLKEKEREVERKFEEGAEKTMKLFYVRSDIARLPDDQFLNIEKELADKSRPEEIISSFLDGWGYKVDSPSVSVLIKPTEADLKSGKIVRNLSFFDPDAHHAESDWESRIPLNRIVGLIFGKSMILPDVVNFARDLHIPIYDSHGGLIWPSQLNRDETVELAISNRAEKQYDGG